MILTGGPGGPSAPGGPEGPVAPWKRSNTLVCITHDIGTIHLFTLDDYVSYLNFASVMIINHLNIYSILKMVLIHNKSHLSWLNYKWNVNGINFINI